MAKHHILAFFAASFLSQSLSAATPVLGPEVPLTSGIDVRTAAYEQTAPAAASNGTDHLVVWVDGRRSGSDIYAARVGIDGRPVEPLGRRIAAGTNPRIASAGGDYLVAWQTAAGIQSLRLSADGAPLAVPHAAGSGELAALTSNGSTYLLVSRPGPSTTESVATILDRDGVPLRNAAKTFRSVIAAASYGGQYFLIDYGVPIMLRSVTQDGVVADRVLQMATPGQGELAAAFAPGAILLVWSSGRYALSDYDGRVIKESAISVVSPSRSVVAAWDGSEFLTVFTPEAGVSPNPVIAFRITPDGLPLGVLLPLSARNITGPPTFASNGAAQLIVWSETREFTADIVARAVPSFSALPPSPPEATLLSYSGEAQGDVQIARGPRGVLTVWDDADRWLRVSASFNGGPPVVLQSTPGPDYVGWPAVMAGEDVFLVVWRNATLSGGPDRLLAKRFDFDGHDLDPQPLIVMSESPTNLLELQRNPQTPSIAFDGTSFFVVWVERTDLYTIRVPESGSALDERETSLAGVWANVRSPRALWTGNELLIGYTGENGPTVVGAPSTSDLAAARLDRAGTTLSQNPPSALARFIGFGSIRLSAALAADDVTFAWVDNRNGRQDITAAQTTLDGRAKGNPVVIVRRAEDEGPASVEIIWNGTEYVLAWVERGGMVKALRLDAGLRRLDSEPFVVSAGPGPLLPPWLIRTQTGVLIAYSRADAANGDAPRPFMRSLARQPIANRHRAVIR